MDSRIRGNDNLFSASTIIIFYSHVKPFPRYIVYQSKISPNTMKTISKQRKLQHLYNRAGFGESISVIKNSEDRSLNKIAEEIFFNSKTYTELSLDKTDKNEIEEAEKNKNDKIDKKEKSKKEKKTERQKSRDQIKDLNIDWMDKMTYDKAQLREKMTLFWHGHFACRTRDAKFCVNQNNTLRKHALGKFGELLISISKDPAMLQYLNNQQNKKSSPNENFAREVMELFTLGRGHYTEQDVKEAARSFTGWAYDKEGEFVFRNKQHDFDEKTFFGKTGNFTGEDIIQMILEEKRTAEFITEKIYKYFVNENVNKEIVSELAAGFYNTGYDIEKLMKVIFTSEWFYDEENIGARIKSPMEFIVGMSRSFKIEFANPMPLLNIQKALGQTLFNPPNVAGWAGGKSWIDTSSLMYRLKLPEIIFHSSNLEFDYKDELPEMGESSYKEITKKEKQLYRQMKSKADLKEYIKIFSEYDDDEIADELMEYLLQTDPVKESKALIKKYSDPSDKENLIESLTLRIVSLPEYQLN